MKQLPILQTDKWESWGRVKKATHSVIKPAFRSEVAGTLNQNGIQQGSVLPVGLARSYGISGLNSDNTLIDMTNLDRLIAFDPASGILRVDAGASLWDVIAFAVPRGWFLPTTPGTRFVTIGGAIANDVHGKNHHVAGTFGAHVSRIGLHRSDIGCVELSLNESPDLFAATIGGLGLTGIIVWADVQLVPISSSHLGQEQVVFAGLSEFFALASEYEDTHEHQVAWIDCMARSSKLGRGIFTAANWSDDGRLEVDGRKSTRKVPFDFPGWSLNSVSVSAFNSLFFHKGRASQGSSKIGYGSYFYPLDQLSQWNRIYGKRGFYQYQSVVPKSVAEDATREMLEAISKSGQGSFLVVLKTFGFKVSPGMMSFPFEGTTLALDFPNRGEKTMRLFERLDAIVLEAGGRLYPAKDGRVPKNMMIAGYSRLNEFLGHVDPSFSSDLLRQLER